MNSGGNLPFSLLFLKDQSLISSFFALDVKSEQKLKCGNSLVWFWGKSLIYAHIFNIEAFGIC